MRVFRNTNINFGLINIPVEVYNTSRTSNVEFKVCDHDGTLLERVYVHPQTREEIDGNTYRSYNGAVLDKSVIDTIKAEAKMEDGEDLRQFNIQHFIPLAKIPFNRVKGWYYLAPTAKFPQAVKSYKAIVKAMERDGLAAICKWVSAQRQEEIVLYPVDGVLNAVSLTMAADIIQPDEDMLKVTRDADVTVSEQEVNLASQLMGALLDPEAEAIDALEDTAIPALRSMAEEAGKGAIIEPTEATVPSNVVPDLMAALEESLKSIKKDKPKAKKAKA